MNLLQMSLSGAIMILAIIVIRALTLNRLPKKTFLVLWAAVLIRLLVPFSLSSGMSIYSMLNRAASPITLDILDTAHVATAVSTQASNNIPQTASASVGMSGTAIPVWGIIWVTGVIVIAVLFAVTYWKCYQEFQMSLPVENNTAQRWLQSHPLRRTIAIRQSDRISSPLTFGVWHPVILMPKTTDWENEVVLQYVLEHEFTHIRRFDIVSKILLIAAVCVHWFNPLVWVMYILANRDIELSCDEAVIHHFGSDTRALYARILISMEETKSGLTPLCNHFSRNAIEERITAIMKTRKTTILSLAAATFLIAGIVTVFATSAQAGSNSAAETTATSNTASETNAVESGKAAQPCPEYIAAGITLKKNSWYYHGKPIAGIVDDNGGIYTDDSSSSGIYLNIKRKNDDITDVVVVTKKKFQELMDQHMGVNSVQTTAEQENMMSYINPDDGKTYYSFDDGKTFEPMTDAEFEARFPTQNIEWWTYDGYKAWLDKEKVQLQSMLGEKAWTSGDGEFVWTQEKINETIAEYESILEDIKNGIKYSKSVDGQEDTMMIYNPADRRMGTSTDAIIQQ